MSYASKRAARELLTPTPDDCVPAEQLDYALRRRIPGTGRQTSAESLLNALTYGCCQHMVGRKREEAQEALRAEATHELQALLWPGTECWQNHLRRVAVRGYSQDEALPHLKLRGSFSTRAKSIARTLHERVLSAPALNELGDPSLKHTSTCDEDDYRDS